MRVRKPFRTLGRILFLRAPIEAQLIITRRCNLSCGYCNEYDNYSEPVPLKDLNERIDALHRLRVVNINIMGGEPLMHPHIAELVAYANYRSQVSVTTNGFLLSDGLIQQLNAAGLSNMQLSVDTLDADPSRYIQKSLKWLAPKLERLSRLAEFDVHVTIVLCESSKSQFGATVRAVKSLGFPISVNLVHDEYGKVEIHGPEYVEIWEEHFRNGRPFSFIEYEYGKRLLSGERPIWKCRAGARYLYVDEFGNVQYCSSQRGRLNKPVADYTREDIRRQSHTYKGCEGGCSIFCAYRDSQVDNAPFRLAGAMYRALRRGILTRRHAEGDTKGAVLQPSMQPSAPPLIEV